MNYWTIYAIFAVQRKTLLLLLFIDYNFGSQIKKYFKTKPGKKSFQIKCIDYLNLNQKMKTNSMELN